MIYPQLPTLEALDKDYEVVVARMRDAYHDKNTAEAEIERLKNDPTECGTSIFQTRAAAERYYGVYYQSGKRAVDEKLKDGEISINLNPPGEGYWDADQQWWRPFYAAHLENCRQLVSKANGVVNTLNATCAQNRETRWCVQRLATVSEPALLSTNAKAYLSTFLQEHRYALRKQAGPVYGAWYQRALNVTSDVRAAIELHPHTVSCVTLMFKGVQHNLASMTISGDATDIHWGPRCTGVTTYLIRDTLIPVESGAHLARLIKE